jgi:hypothetical protein
MGAYFGAPIPSANGSGRRYWRITVRVFRLVWGSAVDELVRLQLDQKASLRELDLLRQDLRDKADRSDVTHLATVISNEHMSAMDRYRAVQASIGDVERALKALSDVVAQQAGVPAARNGGLSRFPPHLLLAGGVALGALAVKSPDLIGWVLGA